MIVVTPVMKVNHEVYKNQEKTKKNHEKSYKLFPVGALVDNIILYCPLHTFIPDVACVYFKK
jgi:hypothetical protein